MLASTPHLRSPTPHPAAHRVRRIREELAEREAIAKADEEVKMEVAVSRAHHDSVNKLLAVDLDSKEAVQTAMEADWPDIRVHRFTKEAKEQEKLKLLILKSFVLISDLFVHLVATHTHTHTHTHTPPVVDARNPCLSPGTSTTPARCPAATSRRCARWSSSISCATPAR